MVRPSAAVEGVEGSDRLLDFLESVLSTFLLSLQVG
jgi:hypothetical protein